MKGISNAETKLTAFIEQYMTQQEFLACSIVFLVTFCLCMIGCIVHSVIVNEKAAKRLRKSLKKDDIVRVHGVTRDCKVLEVNGVKVIVTVEVPMSHIYSK